MIPCTIEELNHVLNKWIEDGIFKPYKVAKPPIEQERKKPIVPHALQLCSTCYQKLLDPLKALSQEATRRDLRAYSTRARSVEESSAQPQRKKK